jgi:putative endonuclease
MKRDYAFYVYIMASRSGTLYVGMTNNIQRRVEEHRLGQKDCFTKWYDCTRLVFVEFHQYVLNAIEREKQIKSWSREKKEEFIRALNPHWDDLADQLYASL